jgi:hypothetical protein
MDVRDFHLIGAELVGNVFRNVRVNTTAKGKMGKKNRPNAIQSPVYDMKRA